MAGHSQNSSGNNGSIGSRIGKSLIKFFKPVRIALPHLPNTKKASQRAASGKVLKPSDVQEKTSQSADDAKRSFTLLQFEKGAKKEGAVPATIAPAKSTLPVVPNKQALEPTHSNWLELVAYLLEMCKKASLKMRKGIGLEAYRKALNSHGHQKLKTVGSIIDTTPTVVIEDDSEEAKEDDEKIPA